MPSYKIKRIRWMLVKIKGYEKFERVLWGEVDKGCSDMLVARASVWRMGRKCGVV
jgi:hypothetical protein